MMLYSKTCEHAIRALAYVAGQSTDGLILVADIAESEDMPRAFTSKILRDLVRAGLLSSSRGPGGGYAMARDPGDITLLDIKRIVDGADQLDRCAVGLEMCSDVAPCPLHDEYKLLRNSIRQYLENTTLAEMAGALKRKRVLLADERA
ncbi:MAG: Rrf2 family transcriptional regulator [Gemmatimonadota bacterium]|nr:Rrf2 family transcriptional regulator [Gemmatimonadota bacterium]